ncbi:Uncharacterised protein [Neisseria meningitidis]|nr:Uncharacterised protein [Neisseria meningitidis]CWO26549.1 Uncharacterised protein [Neisseria meningitidis]CWO57506.1 Uncharacterised protein [Neisseria meningitidis]CWQ73085.1 Uncharacterised protein [Neisseria meningitidis]CWT04163.1 Uncharacterised protein [Neisseria meningitidis]
MLPVFRTVIAFVGIDGRTFGQSFQQRRQVFALIGIGGGNVQFLDIAFRIGTGMLFVTEFVEIQRASLSLLGVVWPLICPSSSTSMAWRCLLPAV